jgi:hypothetical protein
VAADPSFDLVYEVGRDGWDAFVPLLIPLLATMTAFAAIIDPKVLFRSHGREPWARGLATFLFSIALLFLLGSAWVTASRYREFSAISNSRACTSVEGFVEDLRPVDEGERFRLSGIRFSYSDFNLTGGFNDAHSHVEEGRFVRICYVPSPFSGQSPIILRLEIQSAPTSEPV